MSDDEAFARGFHYGLEAAVTATDGLFVITAEIVTGGEMLDCFVYPGVAAATARRDRIAIVAAGELRRLRESGAPAAWLLYGAEP